MNKYMKLFVSGAANVAVGFKLIPLDGITDITQDSATQVTISYGDIAAASGGGVQAATTVPAMTSDLVGGGDSTSVQATYDIAAVTAGTLVTYGRKVVLTTDAIAANATTWRDFLQDQLEVALTTAWTQPVYLAAGSQYPANAADTAPTTITALTNAIA